MVHDNRSQCPVCARSIRQRLIEGSRYNCPGCGNEFVLKWRKAQRDYIFINIADLGKGEPLYLPRGSVRSIITLTVSFTIWLMLILENDPPHYLLNLALIMVGYYFAFRIKASVLKGVPSIVESGTKEPLYMPRGMVRWIIIGGFFGVGALLLLKGDLLAFDLVEFYAILTGITLGYTIRKLVTERLKYETPMWLKNTKSIIVISMALYMMVIFVGGLTDHVPIFTVRGAIVLIGFYFGSRN